MLCEIRIPKTWAQFTLKHLCWSLVLIKLQPSSQQLSLKERRRNRCFSLNLNADVHGAVTLVKNHVRNVFCGFS